MNTLKKLGLIVGIAYILALVCNFIPSIKFPDSEIGVINIIVTIIFLGALVVLSLKGKNWAKTFLLVGTIGGIVVSIIHALEMGLFDNAIYGIVSGLQYPFYILFITPLFGGNALLEINYGLYSFIIAGIYLVLLLLNMTSFKKSVQQY